MNQKSLIYHGFDLIKEYNGIYKTSQWWGLNKYGRSFSFVGKFPVTLIIKINYF